MDKDYALGSGERQVGKSIADIRKDHIHRYSKIIEYIENNKINVNNGLDAFCGNGYGAWMLSSALDCEIIAVDGSQEAIELAKEHYSTPKTKFVSMLYPFDNELYDSGSKFDFITSIESVEHVSDYVGFLSYLKDSLKTGGVLYISVPNKDKLDLEVNPNPFHVRHFSKDDIVEICDDIGGLTLLECYGQDTYTMNGDKISGYMNIEDTGLVKNRNGQFLMFIFKKID